MSGWASVITNVGELAEDSVSGRGCVQKAGPAIAGFEDGGRESAGLKCGRPPETGKGKKTGCPLELPERNLTPPTAGF